MAPHSSVLAWKSQGWGSLVGCRLWDRTELDTTEATQQQQQQQHRLNTKYLQKLSEKSLLVVPTTYTFLLFFFRFQLDSHDVHSNDKVEIEKNGKQINNFYL